MDKNLIIPPQDKLYMILDTKELVKSLNNIHEDLCDIQATIREQNDLLDKLVNPEHKYPDLYDPDYNKVYCMTKGE